MKLILNKKKVCVFDFLKNSVLKLLDLTVCFNIFVPLYVYFRISFFLFSFRVYILCGFFKFDLTIVLRESMLNRNLELG